MSSAPLVGARGEPISSRAPGAAPAELVRPQPAPLPALAGVTLVRIRPARNALPEAWRIALLVQVGIAQAKGINMDLPKGLKARELARGLRAVAQAIDALVDQAEADTTTKADHAAQAQLQPARLELALGDATGTADRIATG